MTRVDEQRVRIKPEAPTTTNVGLMPSTRRPVACNGINTAASIHHLKFRSLSRFRMQPWANLILDRFSSMGVGRHLLDARR
jgi:hypothetical protein